MTIRFVLMMGVALAAVAGCGSSGGSDSSSGCPSVSTGLDAGWPTIDYVANCESCTSGSKEFTCTNSAGATTDSLTVTCANNQISGSFASTSDCTEGGVSCFNTAINTSCVDTASE